MSCTQTSRTVLVFATVAVMMATGACGREDPEAPVSQMHSQSPEQVTHHPTTVTGCLRAGEAPNTFVLTTAQSVEGEPTATYELIGTSDVDLLQHVGRRVHVSGVLRGQQELATRSATRPAQEAEGTAGTPTVATTTELSIRHLNVESIREAEGTCEL